MEAEASAGSSAAAGSISGELLSRLMDSVDDLASIAATPEAEAESSSSSRLRASPLSLFAALVARLSPILRALLLLQQQQPPSPEASGSPGDKTASLDSLGTALRRARFLAERSAAAPSAPVASRLLEGAVCAFGGGVRAMADAWADAPAETRGGVEVLLGDIMDARFKGRAEEIKGGGAVVDVEDLVVRIKNGDEDEQWVAMFEIEVLIGEGFMQEEGRELIPALLNRVTMTKSENRLKMILVLRSLASISTPNKERMASIEVLSTLVRSLSRDAVESREAVGLLLDLSAIPKVRQRIGRVQGCMVMLVTLRNGEDTIASDYAGKLLCVLSANAHNVLLMAEAGYFIPLVRYLKEGSEMNKILMANVVSRMKLTDQMKSTLGEEGSIESLVKMFTAGKLEAKLSALGALRNLSGSTENIPRLIEAGAVEPLLQLLFSVTSVLVTLREPAAAILASIAQSDLILMKKGVALQMLSLLNHSSPLIQSHLLQALNSITSHGNARRIRTKMRENGAVQLLLLFLTESNAQIRVTSLNLLFHISRDFDAEEECFEQVGETHLKTLVSIILTSTSEEEKAAAVGILSTLPGNDKRVTEVLVGQNLLPVLISLLGAAMAGSSGPTRAWLLESIAGVMVRFTVPSDKKLQRVSVSHGVISCLLMLLSHGSAAAKAKAAVALAQLSQSTPSLSRAKPGRWLCVPPSSEAFCDVHGGACGVKSTFCLVKAGALPPLVRVLEGKEREADVAVLDALATVLEDEIWEKGVDAVERAAGVPAMVRILEVGGLRAQEKAIWILERVFRLHSHRERYGEAAQLVLIDLTQKGDPTLRPMIARVLAHLQLLQMQSSYF